MFTRFILKAQGSLAVLWCRSSLTLSTSLPDELIMDDLFQISHS